jgi:hypothetical protein
MDSAHEVWDEVRRLVENIEKLRTDLEEFRVHGRFAETPLRYWELRREMDSLASQLVTVAMRYHSKVKSEWIAALATDGRKTGPAESPEEPPPELDPKPRPA